jgi:hypothetical protein
VQVLVLGPVSTSRAHEATRFSNYTFDLRPRGLGSKWKPPHVLMFNAVLLARQCAHANGINARMLSREIAAGHSCLIEKKS